MSPLSTPVLLPYAPGVHNLQFAADLRASNPHTTDAELAAGGRELLPARRRVACRVCRPAGQCIQTRRFMSVTCTNIGVCLANMRLAGRPGRRMDDDAYDL